MRPYRDQITGVLQTFDWVLHQPEVHKLYRTKFSGVDIFSKLASGPESCASLTTVHEEVRVFHAFIAMAETNLTLPSSSWKG